MVAAVGNAMQAYNAAVKRMGAPGIESRENAGPGFSDVLKQVALLQRVDVVLKHGKRVK